MDKLKKYRITEQFDYDEIAVDIVIKDNAELTEEEAHSIGEDACDLILTKDGFIVDGIQGEKQYILKDSDKGKYQFSLLTKELPPPIPMEEIEQMSEAEKMALFSEGSPYEVTEEDYEKKDWSISEVYAMLKEKDPNKDVFVWESISYGIDEIK